MSRRKKSNKHQHGSNGAIVGNSLSWSRSWAGQQQRQCKRNRKEKAKRESLRKEFEVGRGRIFSFISFCPSLFNQRGPFQSKPSRVHRRITRKRKTKIKNAEGEKIAELLAEKSFLRLHLRLVASGLTHAYTATDGTRRIFFTTSSFFCYAVYAIYNIFSRLAVS